MYYPETYDYAYEEYHGHLQGAMRDHEQSIEERRLCAEIATAIALGVKSGFFNER
jgi:hypothetical protein